MESISSSNTNPNPNQENIKTTNTRPLHSRGPLEKGMTVQEFEAEFSTAADAACPSGDLRSHVYKNVHVLMLQWAEDDLQAPPTSYAEQSEVRDLSRIFRRYGYNVEVKEIPCTGSHNAPGRWLSLEFSKYLRLPKDDLLIVYYAGHGMDMSRIDPFASPSVWASAEFKTVYGVTKRYELDFNSAKYGLDMAEFDVVYLIDACYAGTAAYQNPKEVLAASDSRTPAAGIGSMSFTARLIVHLHRATRSKEWLSVASLHALIVDDVQRQRLRVTPVHTEPYPAINRKPSIIFLPLPNAHYTLEAKRKTMADVVRNRPPHPTARMIAHIRTNEKDVLASLKKNLERNPDGTMALLVKYLQYEPTGSGMLMFSVDVSVWHCVVSHPALHFIGFGPPILTSREESYQKAQTTVEKVTKKIPSVLNLRDATNRAAMSGYNSIKKMSDTLKSPLTPTFPGPFPRDVVRGQSSSLRRRRENSPEKGQPRTSFESQQIPGQFPE